MKLAQLIVFILVMFGSHSFAQETENTCQNRNPLFSGRNCINISVSQFGGNFSDFNKDIISTLGMPLNHETMNINLSMTNPIITSSCFDFDGQIYYQHHLPQSTQFSDSIEARLTGYQAGMNMCFDLTPNKPNIEIMPLVGYAFGRYKLKSKDLSISNEYLTYTNPYFALNGGLNIKIYLKKFVLFGQANYVFDISNGHWFIKDKRLPMIGKT